MTQEQKEKYPIVVTDQQMLLESELGDVLDELIFDEIKSINTSIEELENGKLNEENIVLYAQILNNSKPKNKRNDSEYFNRPARELILEWALGYVGACAYYGKKL